MSLKATGQFRLWKALNGLICLYKPAKKSTKCFVRDIQNIICRDLVKIGEEPPRQIVRVSSSFVGEPIHVTEIDYSDHPLVIGPRFIREDVGIRYANFLGHNASGVCVLGVNEGARLAKHLQESKPAKVYHVSGEFGISTLNYFIDGKIVEKATQFHIFRPVIDKVLASMQSSYQRAMFIGSGVPLQSQAAYDMAVGGLIRSGNDRVPVVYGLKCIHFKRPSFKIEVTCMNETDVFLAQMIHDIGTKCRSAATCTQIKCVRFGPFSVNHALLCHDWNAENFANNIKESNRVYELNLPASTPDSAHLQRVVEKHLSDDNSTSDTDLIGLPHHQ